MTIPTEKGFGYGEIPSTQLSMQEYGEIICRSFLWSDIIYRFFRIKIRASFGGLRLENADLLIDTFPFWVNQFTFNYMVNQ